jgi:serine protease Do
MKSSIRSMPGVYGWIALLFAITVAAIAMSARLAVADAAADSPRAVFEAPTVARSFADVVETVSPSVVAIAVTKEAEAMPTAVFSWNHPGGPATPFDDFFGRFFDMPGVTTPNSVPSRALGSGFLVDRSGYIVTNNHVVDGAKKIVVVMQDKTELDATLIGTDPKTDLALLKVESDTPLPALSFGDSDSARVGDWVLAIGNPFGLGGTATAGIISARGRDIRSGPYDDYLQIDAPINSGNSGGPVFNADGEVIGVNTAIYSPNGGNVGIGFAIPSKQVKAVVAELETSGSVRRGWLGVQIQDVDKDLARGFGLEKPSGALVADVVEDSPADDAGLRVGDVIVRFGDTDIDTAKSLSVAVADADPSNRVPVRILRDGKQKTVQVKLGEAQQTAQASGPESPQSGAAGELGLSLSELTDRYRQELGLPDDYSGVVVTSVQPGSSAAEQGLRPGDAISRIGAMNVDTVAEAKRAIQAAKSKSDHAALLVRRGEGQQFVSVAFS